MQVGRSTRVLKLEYALLFTAFGANMLRAQTTDYGQAPTNTTSQSTCDPTDPSCQGSNNQNGDQGNLQGRSSYQGTQQPQSTQGIVLQGQPGSQQITREMMAARAQQEELSREARLLLDSPTEFQLMVANSTGKMLPSQSS
jgi:hypothetical protein